MERGGIQLSNKIRELIDLEMKFGISVRRKI